MHLRNLLMSAMLVVLLAACASDGPEKLGPAFKSDSLTEMLDGVEETRLNDKFIRAGVKAIEDGDYVAASKSFNRALKFDPANANLHFLNGLTYHLRAETGDTSQYEFATVGYDLALRYDSSNYWAAYLQGHILLRKQLYRKAQDAFAYALLLAPGNVTFLKALASASYYAQDVETATSAIEKAAQLAPDDKEILYNRILITGAAGQFDKADAMFAVYNGNPNRKSGFRKANLIGRLDDWRRFHERKPYLQLAQSTSDLFGPSGSSYSDDSSSSDGSSSSSNSSSSGNSSSSKKRDIPRMALVDVVIIRSEELNSTNKGVNLLNGLTATLGGTTFALNDVRTLNDTITGPDSRVTTFTWAPMMTIESTAYSLNIFNDNNDRNEVLARPTLVSLDGKTSEFFSGAVWHVELTGVAGSEGTVTDIPVGIKLEVTPNFIDNDTVELSVSASRAFVEGRSATANFSNFAQTSKTTVTANVVMKFGNTLVLSGLSEKETENQRDGVPLLQDIPLIQYLFSNKATKDFTKSVLILLTPRKPRYTYADGTTKVDAGNPPDKNAGQPNLDLLKGNDGWFKPASTLDAVFYHLRDGSFYKEFRSGDVATERWGDPSRLERMLVKTLNFIYY